MNTEFNRQATSPYDDEIDLYELWQTLWSQKWLIAAITLVTTFGAGLVAINLTPTYEAKTLLQPPQIKHLAQLSIQDIGGVSHSITPVQALKKFSDELLSYENQREYFEEANLALYFKDRVSTEKTELDMLDIFIKGFKFSPPAKNSSDASYIFSYQFHDAELSAKWLNGYVDYIMKKSKNETLIDIKSIILLTQTNLQQKQQTLIKQEKINRELQIINLSEALKIAQEAKITEPAINQQTLLNYPAYLKGTRLLKAEIAALKSRVSDEPFIPNLRDIRQNLELLKALTFDESLIQLAVVDRVASVPKKPIKPKKSLIVAVALVLGGMLGIFVALIRGAVRKRRETQSAANA